MTITHHRLDTKYAHWFRNKRNTEQVKQQILELLSDEADDLHADRDIYGQVREMIARWDNT